MELLYCLSMEVINNRNHNMYISLIRNLSVEMSRILNHLLAITTHCIDLGAITPLLWMFEEREKLLNIREELCGARMHNNY